MKVSHQRTDVGLPEIMFDLLQVHLARRRGRTATHGHERHKERKEKTPSAETENRQNSTQGDRGREDKTNGENKIASHREHGET